MSGAPSFLIAGAYFPAWMFCSLIGITGAFIGRAVFVKVGLDAILPVKFFVYASIGLMIGLAVWIACFQR